MCVCLHSVLSLCVCLVLCVCFVCGCVLLVCVCVLCVLVCCKPAEIGEKRGQGGKEGCCTVALGLLSIKKQNR